MNAPIPAIPEVGVVHGLSNGDYHRHPALSCSRLKDFLVCPANYYGLHRDPDRLPNKAETAGQRTGTLLHTLVLEPETFSRRYAVGPDVSRATKEWKAFSATVPPGVTEIKPDEVAEGMLQANSLRKHTEVRELLSNGKAEVSIFWIDEETGVRLRARPDWMHETQDGWIILDLKTGAAEPWAFGAQCGRLGYDVQDAMYSEGVERATGKPVIAFVFGVIETSAPYLSMCGMLTDASREAGRRRFRDGLKRFAECEAKNEWPGFEGVQLIKLPAWSLAQSE